jgi:hypothetical protein
MNAKQRKSNRRTAEQLSKDISICPECGERGAHWMVRPSLLGFFDDDDVPEKEDGFWTCAKFYGPDGRRDESVQARYKVVD